MREKIKKIKEYKFFSVILLALIIFVQIFNICDIFVGEKHLYHCDEIYSYGLANGFYQPFIESDSVYSHDYQYIDEWFSGEVYRNYLTVQEGEQFRYDSVWYNQSQDRHPPLFYAVLHTICSFFPDTFSFWLGLIPNLIYFAITQIFLYKLSRNILKSKYLSLLFCLLWGFTPAAVNNTLFIRMYCMLTMWTVILMYLHSKLYVTKEKNFLKQLIPIIIVTALGSLTQYLFLFVAFVTAVCFCVRYLFKKQFKVFFAYGLSMLAGVLISFAVFPASVRHLFLEGSNAAGTAFVKQIIISLRYVFSDIFCLQQSTLVWLSIFLPPITGILIILSLPILFLFRKNLKLRFFPEKIRNHFISGISSLRKGGIRKIYSRIIKINPIMTIMLLSTAAVMLIASYTVSYILGFANRYLYIIYPFAALFIFALLCFIFSRLKHQKAVITFLTVLMIFNIALNREIVLYWQYDNDINLNHTLDKSNVIIVLNGYEEFSILSTFAYEFYNADHIFMTNYDDTAADMDKIGSLESDKPLYIMLYTAGHSQDEKGQSFYYVAFDGEKCYFKTEYVDDYLSNYRKLNSVDQYEYIGEYEFVEGDYLVYRLN